MLPWLDGDLLAECVASMGPELSACCMPVDNRGPDATVAGAWNLGRDRVLDDPDCHWLIVCSTTVRFGECGGYDLLDALTALDDHADPRAPGVVSAIHLGWHLTAIRDDVLDQVGRFDSFDRAYCEDSDFIHRHRLAGLGDLWRGEGAAHYRYDVEMAHGDAHSIRLGLADPGLPARAAERYRAKWGGNPTHEEWVRPFGRGDVDWRWTSTEETAVRRVGCRRRGW